MQAFIAGADKARGAYGKGADASLRASAQKLLEKKAYFRKCVAAHAIADVSTLVSGLRKIVAPDLLTPPRTR